MSWDPTLTELRQSLCDLYASDDRIRLVLDDAGISHAEIPWGSSVETTWHSILRMLHERRELPRLLAVLVANYPNRRDLQDAAERYRGRFETVAQGLPPALLNPGEGSFSSPVARGLGETLPYAAG